MRGEGGQGSPQEDFKGCREGIVVWSSIHIKAYCPSTLPHQRKISNEGMLGRHALQ